MIKIGGDAFSGRSLKSYELSVRRSCVFHSKKLSSRVSLSDRNLWL